jgi:RNA exonuclease 1
VRIVKDVQRRNGKGTKGDFKEFIEGTIERSELRKTRDPKRHDWEVLKEFLRTIEEKFNKGDDDDRDEALLYKECVKRHKEWEKRNKKRVQWRLWNDACEDDCERFGDEGTKANALWRLVNLCEQQQQFDENYNRFPSHRKDWFRTSYRPSRWCVEKDVKPRLIAIDCEMCETTADNKALCAVSVVDEFGNKLFDELVKPPDEIIDYRFDITGYTEQDFKDVTLTLDDARAKVIEILEGQKSDKGDADENEKNLHGCVLVGHSLSHDLRALRLDHRPIIDTSLLFSLKELPRATPALADLCKMVLGYEMREKGKAHEAFADALTAMKVVNRIVEKGIENTEFVLPAPERLLILFEARRQAAKTKRESVLSKVGDDADNKQKKRKVNDAAGRSLFVHRLPRGIQKEAIESVFENVMLKKSTSKEEDDFVLKIEAIKGKFEIETGDNVPQKEAISMFASSSKVTVSASKEKHAPTTSALVIFDSAKSARFAFEKLQGSLDIDALGRPQKRAKISKRFGFEKLVCVRNDALREDEEQEVVLVQQLKDKQEEKNRDVVKFPLSSAQKKKKPRDRKPKTIIALPCDKK